MSRVDPIATHEGVASCGLLTLSANAEAEEAIWRCSTLEAGKLVMNAWMFWQTQGNIKELLNLITLDNGATCNATYSIRVARAYKLPFTRRDTAKVRCLRVREKGFRMTRIDYQLLQ
eukprot:3751677-Amphidinium_carterae.1